MNPEWSHDWIADSELQHLSNISYSLSKKKYLVAASDTLAAVTLLKLDAHTTAVRTTRALLNLAKRDEKMRIVSAEESDFDRLSAEDRLLLTALHVNHQGYTAAAELLDVTPAPGESAENTVAKRAWWARIRLAHSAGIPYPTGRPHRGPHCPEYDSRKPWTQAFLDDEVKRSDRLFLQNHLMACGNCRAALQMTRNLYYQLDAMVPKLKGAGQGLAAVESLKRVVRMTLKVVDPRSLGIKESLETFFQHRDVQIIAGLFVVVVFWKLTR